MSRACRVNLGRVLALALASSLSLGSSRAADDKADITPKSVDKATSDSSVARPSPDKSAAARAEKKSVDLFDAMTSGQLDVKFVAKNSHDGRLLIKNNTGQPLSVKLPEAFAAVPVLAQNAAGGAVGGTRSNRSSNQNNQNQSLGGGLGGGGYGGNRGGVGGAFDVVLRKSPRSTSKPSASTMVRRSRPPLSRMKSNQLRPTRAT